MPANRSNANQQKARDWRRAVIALVLLVLVAAMSLSEGRFLPAFLSGAPASIAVKDKTFTTGSIVIASPDGRNCELRSIDRNGIIRQTGSASCDQTGSLSNGGATPRIDAVRESFFPRK